MAKKKTSSGQKNKTKRKTPSEQQSNKATGFAGVAKKAIVPVAIPSPVQQYTENMGRSRVPKLQWEVPEWDLAENNRILDVESFVRRSFKNKKNLIVKTGHSQPNAFEDHNRTLMNSSQEHQNRLP